MADRRPRTQPGRVLLAQWHRDSRLSRSFGGIADDPPRAEVELRASWTPVVTTAADMVRNLQAWSELLCLTAGLPPLPDGVVPIAPRRSGTWMR